MTTNYLLNVTNITIKMDNKSIRQVVMITKKQAESLVILKKYNVNISQFIRAAIKEKIQREWKLIKENRDKEYCPF